MIDSDSASSSVTWIKKPTSTLLFLLLTSSAIITHIYAQKQDSCQIEEVSIKDKHGQFQSIFTGETGTIISLKVKNFTGTFKMSPPAKLTADGTRTPDSDFLYIFCQHPNGTNSTSDPITGAVSFFDHLQRSKGRPLQALLENGSCSGDYAESAANYSYLCPYKIADEEACIAWGRGSETWKHLKTINSKTINNPNDPNDPVCIKWNAAQCEFEKMAYRFTNRKCFLREKGKLRVGNQVMCYIDQGGKTNTQTPNAKEKLFGTLSSVDFDDCSVLEEYANASAKVEKVSEEKPMLIPSCQGSKLKQQDFDRTCKLSYNTSGGSTFSMDWNQCEEWKPEILDDMWGKKGHLRCIFKSNHKIEEWADLGFDIKFELQTTQAPTTTEHKPETTDTTVAPTPPAKETAKIPKTTSAAPKTETPSTSPQTNQKPEEMDCTFQSGSTVGFVIWILAILLGAALGTPAGIFIGERYRNMKLKKKQIKSKREIPEEEMEGDKETSEGRKPPEEGSGEEGEKLEAKNNGEGEPVMEMDKNGPDAPNEGPTDLTQKSGSRKEGSEKTSSNHSDKDTEKSSEKSKSSDT